MIDVEQAFAEIWGDCLTQKRSFQIGIDIDDCLTPWYAPAHEVIVRAGLDNGITPTSWHPYREYGIDHETWVGALADATHAGELYQHPPYDGAAEAIRRLYWAGHKIHLITARGTSGWPDADRLREVTEQWVHEYAIPHDSLRFLHDKREANMDYFLEDSPSNFVALRGAGVKVYLLDQPHNRELEVCDAPDGERVYTVSQFADIIIKEAAA